MVPAVLYTAYQAQRDLSAPATSLADLALRGLGRLPIRGPMNLIPSQPTGLAYARQQGLLAVATKSGSVHLIAARPQSNSL